MFACQLLLLFFLFLAPVGRSMLPLEEVYFGVLTVCVYTPRYKSSFCQECKSSLSLTPMRSQVTWIDLRLLGRTRCSSQ